MTTPADYTRCMGILPTCSQRYLCARHCDIPDTQRMIWAKNLNADNLTDCPYFIRWCK